MQDRSREFQEAIIKDKTPVINVIKGRRAGGTSILFQLVNLKDPRNVVYVTKLEMMRETVRQRLIGHLNEYAAEIDNNTYNKITYKLPNDHMGQKRVVYLYAKEQFNTEIQRDIREFDKIDHIIFDEVEKQYVNHEYISSPQKIFVISPGTSEESYYVVPSINAPDMDRETLKEYSDMIGGKNYKADIWAGLFLPEDTDYDLIKECYDD